MVTLKTRLLSVIAVVLMLVSMFAGFVVPTTAEESETQNYRESLKILAVGNSFSRDAMQYLWDIATAGGVKEVALGVLYIGGCSLDTHYENILNSAAAYTYYKNTAGAWKSTKNTKVETAIQDEEWDIITVQQASDYSGKAETFSNLQNILDYLNTNKPKSDTKIFWHMTWAYQSNTTKSSFENYGSDQVQMYQAILDAVQSEVVGKELISGIIPSGTAIQNLRNTALGDSVTRDGYHLSYDVGRYTAALLWFNYFTGIAPETIQWLPSDYAELIRPYLNEIHTSVKNAINEPYRISAVALKPKLIFDHISSEWKILGEDGTYSVTDDYTTETVGSGAHLEDDGFFSEKALGFSDTTTYLEFSAKNGNQFGGASGTTITFWMRKTEAETDDYDPFIVSQNSSGAVAGICSDSLQLFPNGDNNSRWYAKKASFCAPENSGDGFNNSEEWCKFTAVISATTIKIYRNNVLWYDYPASSSLTKGAGDATPKHYVNEVAAVLSEGLAATNGSFRLRGGLYVKKHTTTSRFEELKVYPQVLTSTQVELLYQQDLKQVYSITYELNGGTNNIENPAWIADGDVVVLKPAVRTGYVFDGWYLGTEKVTRLQDVDGAVVLTARWKPLPGDTNKDGLITVYDAVHLLRAIAGLDTLKTEGDCDYDKDGALTTADVMLLLKCIDGVLSLE